MAEARARVERRLDESPEDGAVVAELMRIYGSDTDPSGDHWPTLSEDVPHADAGAGPRAIEAGASLGRYLIIDEIGRGAMGVVLRAYDPRLQREVALKSIRPGAMSSETQARLVREAQAMARLSHPNVVGVHDVELVDDRFVMTMEYVEGVDLETWLRERRTWPEVIEVFVRAGRGLAAAHRAGLLHRDFKPANVLVSDEGEVKVTDFGIALSASRPLSDVSVEVPPVVESEDAAFGDAGSLTEDGVVVGTPAYMPPEQFRAAELTPAADQYAFCVSLWQALSAELPFAPSRRGRGDVTELIRLKLAGPPRWPASAVGVPRRFVEAVSRGLRAQPDARWPSMEALLDELGSEPQRARRRLLALSGVVALAMAGAGWVAYDRAATLEGCRAEGEAMDSTWSAARADAVAEAFRESPVPYAVDTWARAQPRVDAFAETWARARTELCERGEVELSLTARSLELGRACLDEQQLVLEGLTRQWLEPDGVVIERAAAAAWTLPRVESCTLPAELARLETEDDSSPRRAGAGAGVGLRERLADAKAVLFAGRHDEARSRAETLLEEALELERPRMVAAARRVIADALDSEGRFEDAVEVWEAAYAEAHVAGDDHGAMMAANALAFSAAVNQAELDQARRWQWLAELSQRRLGLPDDHPDVASILINRGVVHQVAGELDEAVECLQRAREIREATLGRDHPEEATILGNLGGVYSDLGAFDEAERAQRRALEIREGALGPEHPDVALTLNNLGNLLVLEGELRGALAAHQRVLEIREAVLPPEHPHLAVSLGNLGNVYNELGEHERALEAHQRALAILESTVGPRHPDVAATLSNVGNAYHAMGQWERARGAQERALAIIEEVQGSEHPGYATTLINLGISLERLGLHGEALDALRRARAILTESLGEEHPYVATALLNMSPVLHARDDHAQALAVAERALVGLEATLSRDHHYVGIALLQVGAELVDLGRPAEALAPLQRSLGILGHMEAVPAELGEARFALARAQWDAGEGRRAAIGVGRQAVEELREHASGRPELWARARRWVARRVSELEAEAGSAEPDGSPSEAPSALDPPP